VVLGRGSRNYRRLGIRDLASFPGPQIEARLGFQIDGLETRVRLDFGCGFVDWRGWYYNPGH
jgi:hypothetical protein